MLDTRCESSDNRTKNFFDTGGGSHRQRAPENYSGCGTAVYARLHLCPDRIQKIDKTQRADRTRFDNRTQLDWPARASLSRYESQALRDSGGALSSQYFHSDALQKKDSTSEGNSHGDGYWRGPTGIRRAGRAYA